MLFSLQSELFQLPHYLNIIISNPINHITTLSYVVLFIDFNSYFVMLISMEFCFCIPELFELKYEQRKSWLLCAGTIIDMKLISNELY